MEAEVPEGAAPEKRGGPLSTDSKTGNYRNPLPYDFPDTIYTQEPLRGKPSASYSFGFEPQRPAESRYAGEQNSTVRASVDYQQHRGLDNTTMYAGGQVVQVFEHELPLGLLGFTDTRTEIHVTTDPLTEQFGISKRRVLWHELNHFGEHDELRNRYAEENARHLWDLHSGAPPLKQLAEFSYSPKPMEKKDEAIMYS